jgi:hypothetical protein
MPNIIPAGWFAWLAENHMRASVTVENPDTAQWTATPLATTIVRRAGKGPHVQRVVAIPNCWSRRTLEYS